MNKKQIKLIKKALMAYRDDEEIMKVLDNLDSLEDNPVPSLLIKFKGLEKYPRYIKNIKQEIETMLINNGYLDKDFEFELKYGVENAKKEPKCNICGTEIYINYVCNCPDSEH